MAQMSPGNTPVAPNLSAALLDAVAKAGIAAGVAAAGAVSVGSIGAITPAGVDLKVVAERTPAAAVVDGKILAQALVDKNTFALKGEGVTNLVLSDTRPSSPAVGTVRIGAAYAPPDTTAPSVPTGLTATPSSTQVVLDWSDSTDAVGVTGYKVRRDGTVVATPTASTFTDTGRTNGVTYSYTITALDAAANESAQTAAVTATPAVAVLVADTFTRADSTTVLGTTTTGAKVWTADLGTWGIASNTGYHTTGAGDGNCRATVDSGIVDHDVSVTLATFVAAGLPSLVAAWNGTGGYLRLLVISATSVRVDQNGTGGSTTPTGASVVTVAAVTSGAVLRMRRVGTTVYAYVNGVLTHTVTGVHSDLVAATGVGIGESAANGGNRFDNFTVVAS